MATKAPRKVPMQSQAVRHVDTPCNMPTSDPRHAIWTMDLSGPFMDPVLVEVVEQLRRDAMVTPRTLADIKHPPIIIKTVTPKRLGAAKASATVNDTAMAGQPKSKTANDAKTKAAEPADTTTHANKQTNPTDTIASQHAVQTLPTREAPAPAHGMRASTVQTGQQATSKAMPRRQRPTQDFGGVQRTINEIISKNRVDTPVDNSRGTPTTQPARPTSNQHKTTHKPDASGRAHPTTTNRPHESASKPKQSAWLPRGKIPKISPKKGKKAVKVKVATEASSSSGGWDRGEPMYRTGHLGDWSGGFGPPILDWEYRPPFRPGQTEDFIEVWLDDVLRHLRDTDIEIRMPDYQRYIRMPESARKLVEFDERWTRPIVPAHWMPVGIGNQSPALFWSEHKVSDPKPYDEDDLDGVQPWWDEFPAHQGDFLQVYATPVVAAVDPDETRHEREARAQDKGSKEAAKTFMNKRQQKNSKHYRYPRHNTVVQSIEEQDPQLIKPSIKLLIRPAVRGDMMQIAEIYNRYIAFAICVPEEQELTEEDMKARWQECKEKGLPMLIACEPSHTLQPSRRRPQDDTVFIPEKVIGFAYAQDYTDNHACQCTKIVNFFTAHQYYMKGVGTCLLDKMMQSLSAAHKAITHCDADIPPLPTGPDGQVIEIKNILIHFLWDQKKPEKPQWMAPWLQQKFGYNERATLEGVAAKLGSRANLTIYQKSFPEL